MPSGLTRGWTPVRVKKTRQIKNLALRFDSIETEKALDTVGSYSVAPFPDESCDRFTHRRVVVCNDVEAGRNKAQANDFNGLTAKRSHLIGQEFDFGPAARLLVADNERPVLQPQCGDLGKRDMTGRQPPPLYPAVRIKEDEVHTAHRFDQQVEPLPPQHCLSRDLLAEKDSIAQDSAHVQIRQGIDQRTAAAVKFREMIEHLRSEVSKIIGAFEVVEMPVAILRAFAFTGQVPANGKPAILHKMPEQSELSKVADSSDLPNLHFASRYITGDVHFPGSIGTQFRRLSRKSHTSSLADIDHHRRAVGGHFPQ